MEYVRRHDALKDKIQSAYTEIAPLVSKYADEGRENAKIFMADMLLYGWGIPQDVKKAEEICTVLAENGNAYAQFVMIQRSLSPVTEAPKKESELKTPEEFYQEGRKYYYGEGVIINNAKAVGYFTVAAEGGHEEAQYLLGVCYRLGYGVGIDIEKARYWYEKSAAQGNKSARNVLDSLNKQYPQKKKYTQQEIEAMYWEGKKYYFGQYVPVNNEKAVELFTIAAENGHSEARRFLGNCYRNGYGVSKDLQKARYWYQQSANQGNRNAREALDDLNRRGK